MTDETIFLNYCKEAKSYPLLTSAEEIALAEKIAKGDAEAKKTLINANLRLVIKIACKVAKHNVSVLDLIQEGNLGLIAAAEKFNPRFCTRFSTYAFYWISQYVRRAFHAESTLIPIPENKMEVYCRIKRAHDELIKLYGKTPNEKEIARYLGITEKKVRDILRTVWDVVSLDEKYNEDSEATIANILSDTSAGPEEKTIGVCLIRRLRESISSLPKAERSAMNARYDFAAFSKRSLTQAKKIGKVSTETIRVREMHAISLLKQKEEFADLLFS